jgi:hypothetical protein
MPSWPGLGEAPVSIVCLAGLARLLMVIGATGGVNLLLAHPAVPEV